MADSGLGPISSGINPLEPIKRMESPFEAGQGTAPDGAGFAEILRNQLDSVIELQNVADHKTQEFALGRIEDINEVVLAVQKADIALNFALELRNKVVEAYQEISRMQI